MKLGPHLMLGARPWTASVWKLVDNFEPLAAARAGTLVIGRRTSEAGFSLGDDPTRAAELTVTACLGDAIAAFPRVDAWEIRPNEPGLSTDSQTAREEMTWLGVYGYECARRLWRLGKRAVLGSWAVGTPEIELWRYWQAALYAVRDFGAIIGRHAYGPLDDWYALRHRRDLAEWARLGFTGVPIVLTECGADNVDVSGVRVSRPWREQYGGDPAAYWREWCAPFLVEIEHDPAVLGACLFTSGNGGDPRWDDFDVANTEIPEWLTDRSSQEQTDMVIDTLVSEMTPAAARVYLDLRNAYVAWINAGHDPAAFRWGAAPWWQQLAPGARLRVTDTSAAIYSDAAGGTLRRRVGQGETLDVWRSLKAGQTWSGGRVCVFASAGMELWVDAAAVGPG